MYRKQTGSMPSAALAPGWNNRNRQHFPPALIGKAGQIRRQRLLSTLSLPGCCAIKPLRTLVAGTGALTCSLVFLAVLAGSSFPGLAWSEPSDLAVAPPAGQRQRLLEAPPQEDLEVARRESRALLRQVSILIRQGRLEEAEGLLGYVLTLPEADAIAIIFQHGMLSLARGEYQQAVKSFGAILRERPELSRVRLELARSFFLQGGVRDGAARRQFQRVLDANPPPEVVRNIEYFLAAIRQRRRWDLGFSFSLIPDSNINQAPTNRTVIIGGLPFTLSEDARRRGGVGAQLGLRGSRRWVLAERIRLAVAGNLLRREYSSGAYDDMSLGLHLGPRFLYSKGEAGATLFTRRRFYGGDPYSRTWGLRLEGDRLASPRRRRGARLEFSRLRHDKNDSRDGPIYEAGLWWRFAHDALSFSALRCGYQRQAPREHHRRNHSLHLEADYYHNYPGGYLLSVGTQLRATHFKDADPLFAETRREETLVFSLRGSKDLPWFRGVSLAMSLSHLRNNANIDFYSYRRNLLQLSLRRSF